MPLKVTSARLGLAPSRFTVTAPAEAKTTPSPLTPRSPGFPAVEPETVLVHELTVSQDAVELAFICAGPGRETMSLPVTEPLVAWTVAVPVA